LAISNAINELENVDTNFVLACFSDDAANDAVNTLYPNPTDASSTYTIDAINAMIRSHVIEQSAELQRHNRIGLTAKSGTFSTQQDAAGELAAFRCTMCIEDVKVVGADGQIHQYQPWMAAVIAAGMQAAAGYKGIVKKFANVSAVISAAGDFNPKSSADRITALKAGLLVMEPVRTGGFRWVSYQTTYSLDNNFVFNSLQAVYLADLMALSLIAAFDLAIVGKSVAQISAAGGLAFLQLQMYNFLRLKWISQSDDAPLGYKNASVQINGGVMVVKVEVKLAGLIYFVPISFSISEVTQSASA
jgi:hypothetical protein